MKTSLVQTLPLLSKKPISLLDMIRFLYEDFDLAHFKIDFVLHRSQDAANKSENKGVISEIQKSNFQTILRNAKAKCIVLEMDSSTAIIEQIQQDLHGEKSFPNCLAIATQFRSLWNIMQKEIGEKQFAYIPKRNVQFYEQIDLFGENVSAKFPGAIEHIKCAGNCIAAELHTASVFHLMCVSEIGLRALAKQLRVSKIKKTMPLEMGTWENVIKALDDKVNSKFPRSKKGQRDSDFYKATLIEYRAFKDFWRNKVMHTRIDYDETAALHAFNHVRLFMQRLSERVSEVV